MPVSSAEEDLMILRVAVGRSIELQDIPRHSLASWCHALFFALLLTYAFDSGGALRAQRILKYIRIRETAFAAAPSDIRLFLARKDAMFLKAAINFLLGPHLCFASSFAICAGLQRLGFSCHIVVGYEQVYQYMETPMDAYVVYEHEPVSTTLDATYGFAPMLTYGLEPEVS